MENVLFVGLDVDNANTHFCVWDREEGEQYSGQCRTEAKSIVRQLKRLGKPYQVCYEAGYLGFTLARDFLRMGVVCEVVAPSRIPREAGMSQKTDRIDARKLSKYYSQGLLEAVWIPNQEDEEVRNILRSRSHLVERRGDLKRFILAQCCRMGWKYREETKRPNGQYWTKYHDAWLKKKMRENTSRGAKSLRWLLYDLEHLNQLIEEYDNEIDRVSTEEKYREPVEALVCYRGIDTLTAMTLVAEVGDVRRFAHPRKLTSYVGLDLREYSSGGKSHRFGISKHGNRFIRTAIIEAAQRALLPIHISKALRKRREGKKTEVIEVADRCMVRLYRKGQRMLHRGKNTNKIKVALGREMLSFVWESLQMVA